MNVAIIGANGFIGYHLKNKLAQIPTINLFLFGRNETTLFNPKDNYTKLDLSDKNQVNYFFKNIDVVYYLASGTIPASSWENPVTEIEKNLMPFITFTECIAKLNVKKIILE